MITSYTKDRKRDRSKLGYETDLRNWSLARTNFTPCWGVYDFDQCGVQEPNDGPTIIITNVGQLVLGYQLVINWLSIGCQLVINWLLVNHNQCWGYWSINQNQINNQLEPPHAARLQGNTACRVRCHSHSCWPIKAVHYLVSINWFTDMENL